MTPSGTAAHAHKSESNGGNPTKNVLDLVHASVNRIDDMAELRALLTDEKITRTEREWIHQDKVVVLRAEHARETRLYDNDRWDKIRTIDMANASATAAQLLAAVNNYAAAQERMAQTLRDQVASTADAANKNLAALINPIVDRVAILERSSYTVAGRSAVSDPAMADMVLELRKLSTSRDVGAGKAEGMSDSAKLLMGVLMVMTALMGAYTFTQRPAAAVAPEVIYVPSPPGTLLPSIPPNSQVPR